jgi:hypothetical protein
MFSLLADLQKERGFPHPSRKKKLLKFKRESTLAPWPGLRPPSGARIGKSTKPEFSREHCGKAKRLVDWPHDQAIGEGARKGFHSAPR